MSRTLYLECSSGISGDMTVGALLDLGADADVLKEALKSLPVDGFDVRISRVKKAGLDMCDFAVLLDEIHENHDHDMEYLYGHSYHGHSHGTDAHHVHSHDTETCKASHVHRNLQEIKKIIESARLTPRARETALRIFHILGKAEAKAHGVPEKEVHFHEVGAVDSIVDIVAAAVCLDNLDITEVIVEQLCEGRGTIRCQHGILPVPVPAVVNIVQDSGLRLKITETEGELVTPTGAAIAAAIGTSDKLPESFFIESVGMGAGKRSYDRPSMLRGMLIGSAAAGTDRVMCLEANLDDCTGEMLGYAMERLMENGAKDVSYTPIYMKKNRPAYQLNVICDEELSEKLEQIIFEETTTIGIRKLPMERSVLGRKSAIVNTRLGQVRVKVCEGSFGRRVYPEYEEIARLCRERGETFYEVWEKVKADATVCDAV